MQEDTIYPTAYLDGDGKLLDSANEYVMHYEKGGLPPTNAALDGSYKNPPIKKVQAVVLHAVLAIWCVVCLWDRTRQVV